MMNYNLEEDLVESSGLAAADAVFDWPTKINANFTEQPIPDFGNLSAIIVMGFNANDVAGRPVLEMPTMGTPGLGGVVQGESGPVDVNMNSMDADEADSVLFLFVTYGILLSLIGVLGLTGNALSIVVLSRPQMRSSINCCLIGLATFDIVVLVTSTLMFGVLNLCRYTRTFLFYNDLLYPYLVPLTLYPLGLIAQTGSVWVTVTVTVERFVAVCLPLHAKSLCTYGRARGYIVVISVCSILYNLPRFWEVERVVIFDSVTNETIFHLQPSWLRLNQTYVSVYITWMYLFFLYFVPFLMLALLNVAIWVKVRRANRERQQLSRLQKKEMGLAIMLFCVVVVFFICNVLALVVNVLEMMDIIVDELTVSSNLLVTMNSSVNFAIYCIFGQKFRRILLRTIFSWCPACLMRCPLMRTSGADLEESAYPVSSACTTVETKSLLHFNGMSSSTNINSAVSRGGVDAERSPSSGRSIASNSTTTTADHVNKGVRLNRSVRLSNSRMTMA